MKKTAFVLFILGVFATFYSCEKEKEHDPELGSIYGVITDFATGEPVQSANVQLRPTGETTLTGSDGLYEFLDVEDGEYSITVSKAEYTDLIDDYIIKVKNGRRMQRDVQIEKIPTYIRFTDMGGNDITELDFGSNTSLNMQSFNIYNNGTTTINCQVSYACDWISSVSEVSASLKPGQNVLVSIHINRSKLSTGQNSTKLYVSSNNGSNVLLIKAFSGEGNPPVVEISPISNITTTTAQCSGKIIDTNGGKISDCGFYYSTDASNVQTDMVARVGVSSSSFTYTITNLKQGVTYYVQAFATSNLGTGYSKILSFVPESGIPTCGETTLTHLDPTTVRAESYASRGNGSAITEKGFCWGTSSNPTINGQKVQCGFGDGDFSGYLTSLQPSTTYWVRSYAINEFGTTYGPELSFISHSGLATVTTSTPYLSGDKIITGGNVTDDAGTVIIDRGVCYGSSSNPNLSWSFEHTYDGSGTGQFTSYIPKPSNSGIVYIRAYATTKYGTAYGNEVKINVY